MNGLGTPTVREVVRKYQVFDPETGRFDRERNDNQYAILLGVPRDALSRFYSGRIRHSRVIISAFLRAFPAAGDELLAALAEEPPTGQVAEGASAVDTDPLVATPVLLTA